MTATALPLVQKRLDAMSASPAGQDPAVKQAVDVGKLAVVSARNDPKQLSPGTSAPFDPYNLLVTAAGLPDCVLGG